MLNFSITFLITFVNFAVLYFILRAILFKPVTRFMESRSLKIKGELEQAANEKASAEALRESYEAMLRKADDEADKVLKEAHELAREQSAAIIEQAKAEGARLIDAARAQIEAERRVAAVMFKEEAAGLVLSATAKLLRKEAGGEDSRRAAVEFINELGAR
jgi:F-type H+-transporting ATPase subunit b